MRATMSAAGLYAVDNTLFDSLALPQNVSKEVVVNTILMETQELEIAIPDFDRLKWAIGVWSSKMLPIWVKLQATLNLSYNPIENYDRNELITDTHTINSSDVTSGGDTENHYTAGFNDVASTQANTPASRDTTTLGSTITHGGTDTLSHTARIHGNIGVTTSQEMIKQEREIDEFSLIDHIVTDFKTQFCIMVY